MLPSERFLRIYWHTPNAMTDDIIHNLAPEDVICIAYFIHSQIAFDEFRWNLPWEVENDCSEDEIEEMFWEEYPSTISWKPDPHPANRTSWETS